MNLRDTSGHEKEIERIIACIEEHTGSRVPIFPQPPESGQAEHAGAAGYLIPVTNRIILVIFSVPQDPDDRVTDDLITHARSAAAAACIVLSPRGMSIHLLREPDPEGLIQKLCNAGETGKVPFIKSMNSDPGDIRIKITRYLGELRKELNGFIYHREGEISESLRELIVQTLMNRVLLTRITRAHLKEQDYFEGNSLLGWLFSYADTSRAYDKYDIRIPDIGQEENHHVVHTLASAPYPALSGIRLSWIDPGTWAAIFSEYRASIPEPSRLRNGSIFSEETPDTDSVLMTGAEEYITGLLTDIQNLDKPGRIFDPSPGSGEIIALTLRQYRVWNVIHGGIDTITSRLIRASDLIYASDPSPIHIAMVRFIIVISIIGASFRDPSLSGPPLWYPFHALIHQVRTGNILFSPDLSEEFFSEVAGYTTLRRLHPLNLTELMPAERHWSLVLSRPANRISKEYPETTSYLTRKYHSFQPGIHPAALLLERLYEHLSMQGAGVMVLPVSWLSEDSCRAFRKWISQHLPVTIIIEEGDLGEINRTSNSILVVQRTGKEELTVVRIQTMPDGKITRTRTFPVTRRHLPETDGWTLDDPWEEELMKRFGPDLMPLSGYLFDEIYQGGKQPIPAIHQTGWISVSLVRDGLMVQLGERPDPHALAIIPGQDLYLTGLLSSTLIRWYILAAIRRAGSDGAGLNLIRTLPIRTIDDYSDDECRMRGEVERHIQRIFMLERLNGESRPWHDRIRITRQINETQKLLDREVCGLYRISAGECIEIRRRLDMISSQSQIPALKYSPA